MGGISGCIVSKYAPRNIWWIFLLCRGAWEKKSQIQKRRVNNATIIYTQVLTAVPGPLLLSKVSFGWEAHTFRTIMKLFTFALMMIMLQVINYLIFFDLVLYLCTFAPKIFFGPRENCMQNMDGSFFLYLIFFAPCKL